MHVYLIDDSAEQQNSYIDTTKYIYIGTRLGSGAFCKAYRDGDTVYLVTPEDDYAKEILISIGRQQHIPQMEQVGYLKPEGKLYKTPYSSKLTRLENKRIVRRLRKIANEAWTEHMRAYWSARDGGRAVRENAYQVMDAIIETAEEDQSIPRSIVEALKTLEGWANCYGSTWTFDIHGGNFGEDPETGELLLRDVLFDTEKQHRNNRKGV